LTIFLSYMRARRHPAMHAELLRDLETRVRVEHAVAWAQVALGPATVGGDELVSTPAERERHRRNAAREQPQIGAEVRDVERRIAQSSLVQIDHVRPIGHEHVVMVEIFVDWADGLGPQLRGQLRAAFAEADGCAGAVWVAHAGARDPFAE